jgi:GNAT superfamily N-acetyltransferase
VASGTFESTTRVREAVLTDANVLADLMGELGYPTTSDQMRSRLSAALKDHSYRTFVAEVEGIVVGMIGVRVGALYEYSGNYAHILAFVTSSKYRGKGIGKGLLETVENWARKQEVVRMIVNCRKERVEAHRFYEKNGYASTGFRFAKVFE